PVLASQFKEVLKGEVESYILFYYKGLKMLSKSGHLTFITPDSWFTNKGAAPFRKYLTTNHSIKDVFDIYKPFDAAKDTRVHTVLISVKSDVPEISVKQVHPQNTEFVYRNYTIPASTITAFLDNEWRFYIDKSERKIFDKIESLSEPLENLFNVKYGLRTGDNSKYVTNEKTDYPVIAGADIASLFHINWKPKYLQRVEELSQGYFEEYYTDKKIIVQRIRTNSLDLNARWIEAAYIEGNYIPNDSLTYLYEKSKDFSIMYLLAVLNSFLMNRYYRAYYTDVNVKPTYLSQLPVPKITLPKQKPFIVMVERIISLKQRNQESVSLEKELDVMVFKLFTLSYEEVKVINPDFWLTEKQYNDFKVQ
ncbi:MAG TPA: TaqI-like C-terminal specificity domain-containing protein, partial [Cyclobacteriaceae bacterium]|nr:TaqI-like C-terminal specificity domain-containing protein [Cyclobacteriaceae bacterium]